MPLDRIANIPAAAVLAVCLAAPVAPAQRQLASIHGEHAGAAMGQAVAGVLGAGGASYLLVGAPHANSATGQLDTGTVTVRAFASGQLARVPAFFFPIAGASTGDRFGSVLAPGGAGHFLVGAPEADPPGLTDAGLAMRIDASTGARGPTWNGTVAGGLGGTAVAWLGDLDGNGTDDIALGQPNTDFVYRNYPCYGYPWYASGRIQAFSVTAPAVAYSTVVGVTWDCDGEYLGTALAPLGSIASGSLPVFLAGSSKRSRVRVLGWDTSNSQLVQIREDAGPSTFGTCVCAVGDQDGDGFPDYAAGAPGAREVQIRSGVDGTLLRQFVSVVPDFGRAIADVGDQDGGGRDDLLVGAPAADSDDGAAFVFSAETGRLLAVMQGKFAGERFGTAVAAIADWTGDGVPELAVGAPAADVPDGQGGTWTGAGRAAVFTLDCRGVCHGHGCAPAGTSGIVPTISQPRGPAWPGNARFRVGVVGVPPATQAILFLGLQQLTPPIQLDFLGMTGCEYRIATLTAPAVSTVSPTTAPVAGHAYSQVTIPIDPAVPVGAQLEAQWYVLDPAIPGTLSAGMTVVVAPPPGL
ncbi:MAG: hypothetical protein IPM29_30175 [Planctomycetes bacterium]|nr:hypothetical protein [Planctomycetota bacterium]